MAFVKAWDTLDTRKNKLIPDPIARDYALSNAVYEAMRSPEVVQAAPSVTSNWQRASNQIDPGQYSLIGICLDTGMREGILFDAMPHESANFRFYMIEPRQLMRYLYRVPENSRLDNYLKNSENEYLALMRDIHRRIGLSK